MKKVLQISFILLYAQLMVGVTIANHFCCGTLAWQSILPLQSLYDCGCGDDQKCDCCSIKLVVIAITDEHLVADSASGKIDLPVLFSHLNEEINNSFLFASHFTIPIYELPPGTQPVYILNRALLI